MNCKLVIIIICLFFSSCTSERYGNFLTHPIETDTIIISAVDQLKEHYPPAKTRLQLQSPPNSDLFGTALIGELRNAGYEMFENQSQEAKKDSILNFSYIIDNPLGSPQFVRLTLFVGSVTMSCGYDRESLKPISMWTKGEV